jgi:hypothetical protein
MRRAALAITMVLGAGWVAFSPSPAAAEWNRADTGEWKVVWSVTEALGQRNLFPDLGLEVDFPIRWRRLDDSSGNRLVLFDSLGRVRSETPLEPGESVLASPDGSVHVRWTVDSGDRNLRHLSYWITGEPTPLWEASARGEPALLAPDGGVLVVTTPRHSVSFGLSGRPEILQIIGSAGEVRQELPFAPLRSVLTDDARRLLFLRPGELVALERDGSLAWTRELPIDDVPAREGSVPVSCGGSRIAVCGTGAASGIAPGGMHQERRGHLRVYDTRGRLEWRRSQQPGEETWFSASSRLSPDGEHLATVRTGSRGTTLSLLDGATGEVLWERLETRRVGFRTISATAGGDRVALIHGGARTHVLVCDAGGEVVFEGLLPLEGKCVEIRAGDLLVADRWAVLLRPPAGTPETASID